MEDEQLYWAEEKPLLSMDERVALGVRRCEAFIPATQRPGLPMTYGSGKPAEPKGKP